MRNDCILEQVERLLVAEEERLVGGHGLGDGNRERCVATFHDLVDQGFQVAQFLLARQRREPAFEEVGLVVTEHETGTFLQEAAHEFELVGSHGMPLAT